MRRCCRSNCLLEPAVHRMGAPTGCGLSNLELWSKILRGSCLISGKYTCRSVPQTSCVELARYTASPGVCESTRAQRVEHSSIQSAQNRSKLESSQPEILQSVSRCSSKMPRWGDNVLRKPNSAELKIRLGHFDSGFGADLNNVCSS